MPSELEQAIYTTVRYFNVLDMPVTATQIWQTLLVDGSTGPRWGGHKHWHLQQIQTTLEYSDWLASKLERKWGYIFLPGRHTLVSEHLTRHRISQQKWKIATRAAKVLAAVPFVRGLAAAGSLILGNTKPDSDLDFIIITAPHRIWTTRLLLLAAAQLLGRRRKHWYKRAPDMLCLNHYISQEQLHLVPELHNTYTATLYTLLVPVYGTQAVRAFQHKNSSWITQFVMTYEDVAAPHLYGIQISAVTRWGKRLVESILLEPIGDVLERFVEKIQRRLIIRHHAGRSGRVALSDVELAFHPDTKVPALLAAYSRDPGQQGLL